MPGHFQPIAANMPKGSITDDTEQAILVGELLVEGNGPHRTGHLAQRLDRVGAMMAGPGSAGLAWAIDQTRRYRNDPRRPLKRSCFKHHQWCSDAHQHRVGIAADVANLSVLSPLLVQACQVTHNTTLNFQCGGGGGVRKHQRHGFGRGKLNLGQQIAQRGSAWSPGLPGVYVFGGSVGRSISVDSDNALLADLLYDVIGTSVCRRSRWWSRVRAGAASGAVGELSAFDALCMAASPAATPTPSRRFLGDV